MKCNGNKNMSFKEKIELCLKYKEELIESQEQLRKIESSIALKNEELSTLKNEILELEDFINGKFNSEFKKNCDYNVNIKNCYVISLNGKKYITIRRFFEQNAGLNSYGWGTIYIYHYEYYDTLSTVLSKDGKVGFKPLCHYAEDSFFGKRGGTIPESEEHILRLYPELKMYEDDYVPNTHLKKIYYEINNLGAIASFEKQNMSKVKK